MIDLKDVDRVEVIDSKGRAFTRYRVSDVKMDIEDEGRTLKIFISSQWRMDRNGGVVSGGDR
jgi:sporulation protein YlmC with PRC-barrel domain